MQQKDVIDLMASLPRVLDVGCGEGYHTIKLVKSGTPQVHAFDYLLKNLKAVKYKSKKLNTLAIHLICGDAQKLPYKDKVFSGALCLEVLEHVRSDTTVISEIARVLENGALLCISVPADYGEKLLNKFQKGQHLRVYDEKELIQKISGYFKVQKVFYEGFEFLLIVLLYSYFRMPFDYSQGRPKSLGIFYKLWGCMWGALRKIGLYPFIGYAGNKLIPKSIIVLAKKDKSSTISLRPK